MAALNDTLVNPWPPLALRPWAAATNDDDDDHMNGDNENDDFNN
jgi:hypothetical protein